MARTDDPLLDDHPARLTEVDWIRRHLGSNESFDRTTRLLAALTRVPIAAFSLVEKERQLIRSAFGLAAHETTATEGAFCRTCVATDDLLVVEDATRDDRFAASPLVTGPSRVRFYAGAPVHSPQGWPVGTLYIADTRPRQLGVDDCHVLRDLQRNMEELIRLRSESVRDELTGLHNRRFFEEFLDREWRRMRRSGQPLGLLLIDVDHFEAFNERYGHSAGDICLDLIAEAMRGHLRRGGDVLARYGGEEFAALLANTNTEGLENVAESLCAAVKRENISHVGSPFGQVTISVGGAVATRDGCDSSAQTLLGRADAALDEAKAAGRNCCVVSSPASVPQSKLSISL